MVVAEQIETSNYLVFLEGGNRSLVLIGHDWGAWLTLLNSMGRIELRHRHAALGCEGSAFQARLWLGGSRELYKEQAVEAFG